MNLYYGDMQDIDVENRNIVLLQIFIMLLKMFIESAYAHSLFLFIYIYSPHISHL